jgi:transposase
MVFKIIFEEAIMSRASQRANLILNEEQTKQLQQLGQSRKAPLREIQRAQILLSYAANKNITAIKKDVGVSRPTIYKCIDKALAAGPETGLKDKYHRPKEPTITAEAKAWVINFACSKPTEYGYAAELWTLSALAAHVRKSCTEAEHPSLAKAAKATIQRILKEHPLKPHKIRYYLERRDEFFVPKMHEVLVVYKEVAAQNSGGSDKNNMIVTVSVDEKPGVQALKKTAPDLPPKPGVYPCVARDYEYQRLGTLSILAALDLHTGHVIGQVHDRHRSKEFIELLEELDAYYPQDSVIRIILDNVSSHISKETMRYLSTKPNRFIYVHTPKHGSWLNLVETLFSKMARTFLKGIRVQSLDELRERILKGIAEINEAPVVYRWKKFEFADNM